MRTYVSNVGQWSEFPSWKRLNNCAGYLLSAFMCASSSGNNIVFYNDSCILRMCTAHLWSPLLVKQAFNALFSCTCVFLNMGKWVKEAHSSEDCEKRTTAIIVRALACWFVCQGLCLLFPDMAECLCIAALAFFFFFFCLKKLETIRIAMMIPFCVCHLLCHRKPLYGIFVFCACVYSTRRT